MSFISHGLRCTDCGTIDPHVFYRRAKGPPPCECGGTRKVDWGHGEFPGVKGDGIGSFVPQDMGVLGKCETKEDYDRAVKKIEKRFPGHHVELESETRAQKRTRLDGLKHRSWDVKRKMDRPRKGDLPPGGPQ
jgi:hypothetical protein